MERPSHFSDRASINYQCADRGVAAGEGSRHERGNIYGQVRESDVGVLNSACITVDLKFSTKCVISL